MGSGYSNHQTKLLQRLARLDQQLENLLSLMATTEERALRREPVKSAWTPLQALHHVCLAERASIDYLLYKFGQDLTPPRLEPKQWFRGKLLAVALMSPMKFSAPEATNSSLQTPRRDLSLDSLAEQLRQNRQEMRRLLQNWPQAWENKAVYLHPVAGRIGMIDTLRFMGVHLTRHTKQIRRGLAQNARYYRRKETR